MNLVKVKCAFCGKEYFRSSRRVNESKKFGWKSYCSLKCQYLAKNKQKTIKCANPQCRKVFKRQPHEIPASGVCFCSLSCAAIVNNVKRNTKKKSKMCLICGKQFVGERKFCSDFCYSKFLRRPKITKNQIIREIKEFYKKEGRIPYKGEFPHYNATRNRFGTWNNAIKAAGFEPNPVIFSKKFIAKDGHKCDSFAEKIIDDWLYENKIEHEKNKKYPDNPKLTVDFVTKYHWIEFFGLVGEIKEYDVLIKKKQKLTQKYKLPLIVIYPKDLFPVNHLSELIRIKNT
jgi:hypothetical protein